MPECLSFVVPCHNEAASIPELAQRCRDAAQTVGCSHEIIIVDDGSRDDTREVTLAEHAADPRVRLVSFSRNFGKEAAMLAGLEAARSDLIVLMDGDLQHPPSLVPRMVDRMRETGADQVAARRTRDGDPRMRTWMSRAYYRFVNGLVDVDLVDGVGDFRVMSRQVVDAIISMPEQNRFSKGLFSWVGFHTEYIDYQNVSREAGASSWSTRKLINYAIDSVLSFNSAPLRMVFAMGMVCVGLGVIYLIILILNWVRAGVQMPGYITTIAAIIGLGGMQLVSIGVLGEYVGRIYLEVKRRPHYIVATTTDDEPPAELTAETAS